MKSNQTEWEKDFDEKFIGQIERDGNVIRSDTDLLKHIEQKDFIRSLLQAQKRELVKVLMVLEKRKWDDAKHCSCLPHAIWVLAESDGEAKEEYNDILNQIEGGKG